MRNVLRRILILVSFILVSVLGGCHQAEPDGLVQELDPISVEYITVGSSDSRTQSLVYSGRVRAKREVQLAFPTGGILQNVLVEEGDKVGAGQVLAQLDQRSLQARMAEVESNILANKSVLQQLEAGPRSYTIEASRAKVTSLKEQLSLAQKQYDRRQALFDQGAISREQLDNFDTQLQSLSAEVASAKSKLAELEAGSRVEDVAAQQARVQQSQATRAQLLVQLEDSVLKAPFAGSIVRVHQYAGAALGPGTPVLTLSESGVLEAVVSVPKEIAQTVHRGLITTLETEDGVSLKSRVEGIVEQEDATTGQQGVRLALLHPPENLLDGALVFFYAPTPIVGDGYWVSLEAMVEQDRDLWEIFSLKPTEQKGLYEVVSEQVEVLSIKDDKAFVRGSLEAGEKIIATGVHRVTPGQKVQIAEQKSK